jgi:hypothetical protein
MSVTMFRTLLISITMRKEVGIRVQRAIDDLSVSSFSCSEAKVTDFYNGVDIYIY